jgi:hypothetical protein
MGAGQRRPLPNPHTAATVLETTSYLANICSYSYEQNALWLSLRVAASHALPQGGTDSYQF